jgi:hypothetical protein
MRKNKGIVKRTVVGAVMNRTALALVLAFSMLISEVASTGSAEIEPTGSSGWVEVARGSGGIALNGLPENGTDSFSVSHRDWRIRWSVVPVDGGLSDGDGSDFRFIVRPEIGLQDNIAEVSGRVFSEPKTGIIAIFAHDDFKYSLNRTFYIETFVAGYTYYELIVEENVNSLLLDIVPPTIDVFSPENKTYDLKKNVSLTFTLDKPTSFLWYRLDDGEKVGILRNTSLSGLLEGAHNITVYARDEVGNSKSSETIYFSVEEPPTTTPIAIAVIVAAILNLGILAIYLKKRKS